MARNRQLWPNSHGQQQPPCGKLHSVLSLAHQGWHTILGNTYKPNAPGRLTVQSRGRNTALSNFCCGILAQGPANRSRVSVLALTLHKLRAMHITYDRS